MNMIKQMFKQIPIALNNYYGDPVIQWDNTMMKIKQLNEEHHQGPVAIITRGLIDEKMAKELKENSNNLPKLIVLPSLSGLPKHIEPASHTHRYKTIENCVANGIPVMACVRPLIPELNGSEEILDEMFRKTKEAGCNHITISGFRGDDALVKDMELEEKHEWSLRIKIMSKDVAERCTRLADKYEIDLSKRVSCGVAKALGDDSSFNPYQYCPNLAGCDTCSIKNTCVAETNVNHETIEFLKSIGFDVEYKTGRDTAVCRVTPDKRTKCPSCCTCCFIVNMPKLYLHNENVSLADLTFLRFFTGVLSTQTGVIDEGIDTGISKVLTKLLGEEVHFVNTWMVYSKQLKKCLGCTYCITHAYEIEECENGMTPTMLYNKIINAIENKVVYDDRIKVQISAG